jgi:hypothetical protein
MKTSRKKRAARLRSHVRSNDIKTAKRVRLSSLEGDCILDKGEFIPILWMIGRYAD